MSSPVRKAIDALKLGDHYRLEYLIEQHPGILNFRNSEKESLLMYAIYMKENECIRVLLENGAKVYDKNIYGHTPMSLIQTLMASDKGSEKEWQETFNTLVKYTKGKALFTQQQHDLALADSYTEEDNLYAQIMEYPFVEYVNKVGNLFEVVVKPTMSQSEFTDLIVDVESKTNAKLAGVSVPGESRKVSGNVSNLYNFVKSTSLANMVLMFEE